MNPDQLDDLRDALRRETQHILPVGLGAEVVQRRGRRRRHRGRALVAAGSAACVAGVGVAVVTRRPAADKIAVGAAAGGGSAPALDFRVVDGTVGSESAHVTTATGVTYALSTAPGTAPNATDPGQAIYRTADGEHWSTAEQSSTWIADLTARDGVLYAVGTAPGASASDVQYHLGTSNDDGNHWTNSDLPFDLTPPHATVSLSVTSAVSVARGNNATVVLLTQQFWPDYRALLAPYEQDGKKVSARPAAAGVEVLDLTNCTVDKQQAARVAAQGAAPVVAGDGCSNPTVITTIPWSAMGLQSADDLTRQQLLVSTDGTTWNTVTAPGPSEVHDIVATDDGFLLLASNDAVVRSAGAPDNTLWRSADARSWTAVSVPPGLNVQAVNGDRLIGIDDAGNVETSTDGGTTWNTTDVASLLPAGAVTDTGLADAGPLGFAVIEGSAAHEVLLFSLDGIAWRSTDLAAVGEPANATPLQVTVGADHVAVDFQSYDGHGPAQTVTLLGTPTR